MANKLYLLQNNYPNDNDIWVHAGSYIDVPELNNLNAPNREKAEKHIVTVITNPSQRTLTERNTLAGQLDSFTTFNWGGINMFVNFGAFIINEKKGSLKMYNGASFSNNYTKQQYQDGYTNLSGISFNTQQITFTIGVYWISIEDYRVLMNLLHPYAVDMLAFSFEPKYGYECKLSTIKDSTRYILGSENTHNVSPTDKLKFSRINSGNEGGYRYYTELTLTFDVIGKQCAKQISPYLITEWSNIDYPGGESDYKQGKEAINQYVTNQEMGTSYWTWKDTWPSDLDFPVTINLSEFEPINRNLTDGTYIHELKGVAYIKDEFDNPIGQPITLFDLSFKNLKIANSNTDTSVNYIAFTYDSEQGLIYWKTGNKAQILSLLSINAEGKRFIESMSVNRFFWPGRLDYPEVENTNYKFVIQILDPYKNFNFGTIDCSMRNRTNVI